MAQKRSIRVRLSNDRVVALQGICEAMLEDFQPVNDHHRLLLEYLLHLREELLALMKTAQDNYTLCMTGPESMAFYQLWQMLDIRHDKYAAIIVERMLQKMSSLAA